MYFCAILTENEDYRKSRLSRDLVNTRKGPHGLYTEGEFSEAYEYKITHTPQCGTLKNKLVPEEAIQCQHGAVAGVSGVLSIWLTILLAGHSSTAGQLSAQRQGCL